MGVIFVCFEVRVWSAKAGAKKRHGSLTKTTFNIKYSFIISSVGHAMIVILFYGKVRHN